jgi:hypothetical protein
MDLNRLYARIVIINLFVCQSNNRAIKLLCVHLFMCFPFWVNVIFRESHLICSGTTLESSMAYLKRGTNKNIYVKRLLLRKMVDLEYENS